MSKDGTRIGSLARELALRNAIVTLRTAALQMSDALHHAEKVGYEHAELVDEAWLELTEALEETKEL